MEFKSQICTTREQSKRLLDMGLKPETADMVYHFTKSRVEAMQWELQTKSPTLRGKFWTPERIAKLKNPFLKHQDGTSMTGEQVFDSLWGKDIPAWSLARLLELLSNKIEVAEVEFLFSLRLEHDGTWCASYYGMKFFIKSTVFDACISMIEWLIKNNYFNKDYFLCKR